GSGEPRLIITHIVNYNFKSYAGKKVLGPFHKSFTAIIGPNGSGKSNVIDSMLFVFGYRANKIRSKKLSVLIHNSENHKDATSCTVEVHFEKIVDVDTCGYCTVPDSKFSVSRTARKDSTSQYFIGQRKVQFKEVAALLQNNGIDLNHNRFLILQGEVEQIAMMHPKSQTNHGDGMLEYLEDIIGSSRYKDAIEKLNKEIEVLDEERKDKLSRVKVVEKDKDQLEPVRNEAIAFLKKKNERNVLENKKTQFYENESSREKVEEIRAKVAESEQELIEVREKKKEKAKSFVAALTEKRDEMRELEKQNVKVFEDRKHRKGKIKELTKKLERERKKIVDLEKLPEKHEEEISELTEERDELGNRKKEIDDSLKAAMHSLKQETQELQDQKEEQEKLLLGEVKYVNEAKQQLDIASVELGLFANKLTSAENAVERCREQLRAAVDAEKTAKRKLAELNAKGAKNLEKELEQELEKLSSDERRLESQLRESLSTLMEAKHSAQANRSRGKVISFLMQLKNTGKVKGIYGRLGDLGAIDARYDVAISSCCPALENVLVDSIETARACVEQLKRNDVGQATFIALDKMQKHDRSLREVPDTSLPRLVDLIQAKEPRFHVAFYHALRDTLVADDLAIATKVAYDRKRRWRVVTLQGELIDTAGTMSGGGNRVSKGRMGSNISTETTPAELNAMEEKKNNFEEKHQQVWLFNYKSVNKGTFLFWTIVRDVLRNLHQFRFHNFFRCHNFNCFLCQNSSTEVFPKKKQCFFKQNSSIAVFHPQVRERRAQCEQELGEKREELRNTASQTKLLEHDARAQQALVAELKQRMPQLERELHEAQPDPVQHKALQDKVKKLTKAYEAASRKTDEIEKKKSELNSEISRIQDAKLKPLRDKLEDAKTRIDEMSKKITKLKVAVKRLKFTKKRITYAYDPLNMIIYCIDFCTTGKTQVFGPILDIIHLHVLLPICCSTHWKEFSTTTFVGPILDIIHLHAMLTLLSHRNHSKCEKSIESTDAELNENVEAVERLEEEWKKLEVDGAAVLEVGRMVQLLVLQALGEAEEESGRLGDALQEQQEELKKLEKSEMALAEAHKRMKQNQEVLCADSNSRGEKIEHLREKVSWGVRPPKKSWKTIRHLSGGEKTLSSLALVFALHYYRPTPLYVMDEIDAALDFKNVTIIAHYIKKRTRNAQFIIISLRNNMFEIADRLVGIYKTDNCTKSATIEPSLV
uniref:Structural maintenance of chromosomes protein n=1 Tax=Ciona savignyi TaxID=51511 RepID=H2Z794_CIOSA